MGTETQKDKVNKPKAREGEEEIREEELLPPFLRKKKKLGDGVLILTSDNLNLGTEWTAEKFTTVSLFDKFRDGVLILTIDKFGEI